MTMYNQITIDGPAGSGKSSVANELSALIPYKYISSGSIYRVIAYYFFQKSLDISKLSDEEILNNLKELKNVLSIKNSDIYISDVDVTKIVHSEEFARKASAVSKYQLVRNYVNEILINLAKTNDMIVDGRDMGSVVFKHAKYKFYLDASTSVRAYRRFIEMKLKGKDVTLEEITQDIKERDEQDKNRAISPLIIPKDAYVIDTDNLSIKEVTDLIYDIVRKEK